MSLVLAEFAYDLRTLMSKTIVAHNASFDMPVIGAEFNRLGLVDSYQKLITKCTMLAARQKWPSESAKLGDIYTKLFRSTMKNAHNVGADVRACVQTLYFTGMNK